jgi:hypothetical protein
MNIYRVKADANWHPYQVIFERTIQTPHHYKYPQVYRDDIGEEDDDWETNYTDHMGDLVGKPVEVYVEAADELGAFAQALALLNQHGDHN